MTGPHYDAEVPGTWVAHAACAGHQEVMLLPSDTGRGAGTRNAMHVARARQLCASCPVLVECRRWACTLPDPAVDLVAVGLTPKERRALRRHTGAA